MNFNFNVAMVNTCIPTYHTSKILLSVYTYIHTYINEYVNKYIHAHIHTYIHTYIHAYMPVCVL